MGAKPRFSGRFAVRGAPKPSNGEIEPVLTCGYYAYWNVSPHIRSLTKRQLLLRQYDAAHRSE
jgi:hypothetical protein